MSHPVRARSVSEGYCVPSSTLRPRTADPSQGVPMPPSTPPTSRRDFLKASTAALVGGVLSLDQTVHAAGSDTLRVGLIGCGNRGTGAAAQALGADKN